MRVRSANHAAWPRRGAVCSLPTGAVAGLQLAKPFVITAAPPRTR